MALHPVYPKPASRRRVYSALGKLIRSRRLGLGLTQNQAAKCLGASLVSFKDWELGKKEPGSRHLPEIFLFVGYDPYPISQKNRGGISFPG